VSKLERSAVELLTKGDEVSVDLAYKSLAESVCLKKDDPFLQLAASYGEASLKGKINRHCRLFHTDDHYFYHFYVFLYNVESKCYTQMHIENKCCINSLDLILFHAIIIIIIIKMILLNARGF
jgi:hypothetical protein